MVEMSEEKKTILIVDDDEHMRAALREAVLRMNFNALVAEKPSAALDALPDNRVSLIITDMKMPDMDGLSFMKEARKKAGNLPVLIITGFATINNAVSAMKEGAHDYLMKPFSFESLKKSVETVLSGINTKNDEIITENDEMKHVIQMAGSVASSDMTVLIQGESGTGKEILARYIHKSSGRCRKPFIAVNCAAIPDNLLESELFGFEKGAFTGASEKKIGKFELAHEGTILLDEIGEMSAVLQAKLLRVLQEREIDRIGGKKPVPVDVRVIATTNRDLKKEIQEGRFREDLYYRLSVFPVNLPPLRERTEDIDILSSHFVRKFSSKLNKNVSGFTDEAKALLGTRTWRGNIRELENAVHRAVLIAKTEFIGTDDFMPEEGQCQLQLNTGSLKDMEMDLIMKTLEDTNGNKTKAAKLLGVSVRTIRNKLNGHRNIFPGE
jgi:two-component system response regulator FlrC